MSKNKYDKIEYVMDEIENIDDVEAEVEDVIPTLAKIITTTEANVRPYANHKLAKVKSIPENTELEIVDIVEGVLVQGSNIWYQISDGYVHSSQVKEV